MIYDSSKLLVFVHVPRTGGSGLRDVLRQHWFTGQYQAGTVLDYGATAHHYDTLGWQQEFPDGAQFFTFLRDPLERLAAWYSFIKFTHGGSMLWELFDFRTDIEFSEFIRNVPQRWHQSNFLIPGRSLGSYLFVGDFAYLSAGFEVLTRMLGKSIVELPRGISARRKPTEDLSVYTDSLRDDFARLYPREVALYEEAKELWRQHERRMRDA